MNPILLLLPVGIAAYLITRPKDAAAKPGGGDKPTVIVLTPAQIAAVQQIKTEMPTQFWPDWHRSAANYLFQNLGVPKDHEAITALVNMAQALAALPEAAYAQTVGAMIDARRKQNLPMLWQTIFMSPTAPYFVCNSGVLEASKSKPGDCALVVPFPPDKPTKQIEVIA